MEVLIAAGVTAVGLFGVLALIPVAAIQVQRGITEDRKAVLGKNAIAEIHIRGYRRPANWYYSDGTPAVQTGQDTVQAYCIDPRFVAVRGSYSFPYPRDYPVTDPNIIWMPRVSVWSGPVVGAAAHQQLADEIFTCQDDLEFTIPGGNQRTDPAYQNFTSGNTKRQSAGKYSWFATVVPKHGANAGLNDEYVVSVVVLENRDPNMTLNDVTTAIQPRDANERVFTVKALNSGGTNGGEVTIEAGTARDLDGIVQNGWVMLAGPTLTQNLAPPPILTSGPPDFKWYRILGVDEILDSSGNVVYGNDTGNGPYSRSLTLQGADWQRFEFAGATQATIMAGVVGVFERTIRLETTGLWTQ